MYIHIVDDEPELLASLSLILRREGHDVQTFSTGAAFLSVAENLPAGCVLLDLRLPDIEGLEVQYRLGEMDTDHAVILLTGFGEVPDAVSAMRAGAIDFLRKPYRRENLVEALARASEQIEDNLRQQLAIAETARAIRPDLRVLFTSGHAEQHLERLAEIDAMLLRKPYRRKDLAARLRDALVDGG